MLITYLPAQFHNKKEAYVSYYVVNPATNLLVRKRVKLNRIKSVTERKKYARQLIIKINEKLAEGWNPFIEQNAPKSFHKLFDAMDLFLRLKTKELRPDSVRSYKSLSKQLRGFLSKKYKGEKMNVIDFNRKMGIEFLNYMYVTKNIGEVAYNSHRNFGRLLFNWMMENQYCKVNPYVGIKSKKEKEKIRIPINFDYRNKIKDYLLKNNEHEFLAICMLTYYTFLRPKEICMLKKSYIDIKKQVINLPPEITKNGKKRTVTMPDSLMQYLCFLNLTVIDCENYIFSTYFKPGKMLKDSRYVGKRWTRLRKEINLPKEMQFYSLKDTGIIQMLRDGISPELVRDQAGHSSLEVTNKYVKMVNNVANLQIKNKSGEF